MNTRSVTVADHRRDSGARLALWLALIGVLILLGYTSSAPPDNFLYTWNAAVAAVIQDAFVLGLVLLIARPHWELLALRRPTIRRRTWAALAGALVALYLLEGIYAAIVRLGNEQHLTPQGWQPSHAAAYVVNSIVICTFVPFAEELTYRGLGYSLLARFGQWPAILLVGLLFGLSHGLLLSLPILVGFGSLLAWIRARTDSVVPGMFLHGAFNLVALVWAVVH